MNAPLPPEPAESARPLNLDERLKFLQLTPDDAARLQALGPRFEAWADDFVETFYKHLFSFEATARFLADDAMVTRLKAAQRQHLAAMLAARWDHSYVAQRYQVGQTHADVGIEPTAFLGAYNQYLQFAMQRFAASGDLAKPEFFESLQAMMKAVFLDIGLTLDAYFAQSTAKLRHALDMLWAANVELRQFAQLTSHDLKTPLATVANLCDEALDEFGPEMPQGAKELITAARERTFRMSLLIDELLSSVVGTLANEKNEEVSSQTALSEALDRMKSVFEKREIEVRLLGAMPHVIGDRVRLRETFYNLLSNAAKFIDKRPAIITISVELREDECVFSIADNGPGIPREELERVFVPFHRMAKHREQPGSGLGLYFTKNMVEHQGGRIWVESEPGVGSRFCVLLKRYRD